ncbi:MAG: DUF3847 domain-containing protein [Defluviitaleaceae bacterium]|nr:DUF3847 domain-containing protein [Defluviitaleaceae bacterium]
MSTTTKIVKTAEEKLAEKNEKIKRLQKQKQAISSRENAKERKARNHRLCRRHGLLEKFMPKLITLADAQFEAFIRTGIDTKYGRERIDEIIGKGAEAAAAYIAKCHSEEQAQSEAEQSESRRNNDTEGGADLP